MAWRHYARRDSTDTDASDCNIGFALFQTQSYGERKLIGYWSRSSHAAEKNYLVTEKECLAVVWLLTTLRPYLQGVQLTVHPDHASFRWLLSIPYPSRILVSESGFIVRYKRGMGINHTDAIWRLETLPETEMKIDHELPCMFGEVPVTTKRPNF